MMPDFTKAKLKMDQEGFSNCCGDFKVVDVYASLKGDFAYKVQVDDSQLIYSETELLDI